MTVGTLVGMMEIFSFASTDVRYRRVGESTLQALSRVETLVRSSRRSDWEEGIRLFDTIGWVGDAQYNRVKNMVVRR